MAQEIGTVQSASGEVGGLQPGDRVSLNQTIMTGADGIISITLDNGTRFDLGRNGTAVLDETVYTPTQSVEDIRNEAVLDAEALVAQLEAGNLDALNDLEATASGGDRGAEAPGAEDSADAPVVIDRTGRVGDITAGYDTNTQGRSFPEADQYAGEPPVAEADVPPTELPPEEPPLEPPVPPEPPVTPNEPVVVTLIETRTETRTEVETRTDVGDEYETGRDVKTEVTYQEDDEGNIISKTTTTTTTVSYNQETDTYTVTTTTTDTYQREVTTTTYPDGRVEVETTDWELIDTTVNTNEDKDTVNTPREEVTVVTDVEEYPVEPPVDNEGQWFIAQADNHDKGEDPDFNIKEQGQPNQTSATFTVVYGGGGNYPIATGENVVVTLETWNATAGYTTDYNLHVEGIGQFEVSEWTMQDGYLIVTLNATKDGANLTGNVFNVIVTAINDDAVEIDETVGFDIFTAVKETNNGDVNIGQIWETNDDVLISIESEDMPPPEPPVVVITYEYKTETNTTTNVKENVGDEYETGRTTETNTTESKDDDGNVISKTTTTTTTINYNQITDTVTTTTTTTESYMRTVTTTTYPDGRETVERSDWELTNSTSESNDSTDRVETPRQEVLTSSETDNFPVANDDTFNIKENVTLTSTVATNDNESGDGNHTYALIDDGDSIPGLTFNSDGSFTYVPADADGNQTVTFDYKIVDADGDWDPATVTINIEDVLPPVEPPVEPPPPPALAETWFIAQGGNHPGEDGPTGIDYQMVTGAHGKMSGDMELVISNKGLGDYKVSEGDSVTFTFDLVHTDAVYGEDYTLDIVSKAPQWNIGSWDLTDSVLTVTIDYNGTKDFNLAGNTFAINVTSVEDDGHSHVGFDMTSVTHHDVSAITDVAQGQWESNDDVMIGLNSSADFVPPIDPLDHTV